MARHPDGYGSFPTTHWSLVARAGQDDARVKREALESLLRCYLPALRAHLVFSRHVRPVDADDIVQQFVADKILQRNLIARADQRLGKFRSFLLASLDRFFFNHLRHRRAKKRMPDGGAAVALQEPGAVPAGPEAVDAFDLAWARRVLAETLARMRQECLTSEREVVWGVFQHRVAEPIMHGRPAVKYDQLVARFDLKSPTQAANVLVTGKRMFAHCLHDVIGRYARDANEIEAEIAELHQVLSRHGERP